jgi:hypothetical protein
MTTKTKTTLRTLLVDDNRSVYKAFEGLFGPDAEVELDIEFFQTYSPNLRFCGAELPEAAAFDEYDVALVDLELTGPWVASVDHNRESLRGGIEVLPHLRAEAPWLPVICESKLLAHDAPHIFTAAGSYGFDGLFPQTLLERHSLFSKKLWDEIYSNAVHHRRAAAIGPTYDGKSRLEPPKISQALLNGLGPHSTAFEALLKVAFHFAERIVVTQVPAGYSGAWVYHVTTRGGEQQNERPGYWLAKVSTSPSKLNREIQRHLMMTRSGSDFTVSVPLLWRGVLVEGRLGMIAYRFAEGTHPAAQEKDLNKVMSATADVLRRFYTTAVETEGSTRDLILREFGPWLPGLRESLETVPPSFRPFANAVVDENDGTLMQEITYRRQTIHGDLHTGNIMIGESPVLIDFAGSRLGPVAVDAARLAADLLARFPTLREATIPRWKEASALMTAMQPLIDIFALTASDETLFFDFLALDLWDLTRYDSTEVQFRDWIGQVLGVAQ